jgi:hypothetical protein
MKNQHSKLSSVRINRIKAQGYFNYSDTEIADLAFGNRFAYRLCTSILAIGVIMGNIPVLTAMLTVAFFGVVLPNHPFDYIYNYVLRQRMNKPKLPPRSIQLKFACSLATTFIAITIYLFYNNYQIAAYIVGGQLVAVAAMVSTIDYCLPSVVFNYCFRKKAVA